MLSSRIHQIFILLKEETVAFAYLKYVINISFQFSYFILNSDQFFKNLFRNFVVDIQYDSEFEKFVTRDKV